MDHNKYLNMVRPARSDPSGCSRPSNNMSAHTQVIKHMVTLVIKEAAMSEAVGDNKPSRVDCMQYIETVGIVTRQQTKQNKTT